MTDPFDIVIIGSGPVGQHVAIKSALLDLTSVLIDKGRRHSRAFFVPKIHNIPLLPGISGMKLLEMQRQSIKEHKEKITVLDNTTVTDIEKNGEKFTVSCKRNETESKIVAKNVIFATGVVDRQPEINGSIKPILPYADKGIVKYCMICDGHTIKEQNVCVVGNSDTAIGIAIDLFSFKPKSVTLLTHGKELENQNATEKLKTHSIRVITDEITGLKGLDENRFGAVLKSGETRYFDSCFISLGWYSMGTALGIKIGGHVDDEGFLVTNDDCQLLDNTGKPIDHLFAVGDVRNTWNQIPIGWGDAEMAVIFIWAYYI